MKQIVWLLAVVTLIVGRRHYHSDRWAFLAFLLGRVHANEALRRSGRS